MIKKIKTILLGTTSLALALASSTVISAIPFSKNQRNIAPLNYETRFANLKNEIVSQSYSINTGKYYQLNGKIFLSEEELNQEIFTNGDLQSFMSASKPEDIFLDAAHGILNPKKIEGLNLKNYRRVYRTLYNQAVYNESEALDSFSNENNLKKQYSYDRINWFDTLQEARSSTKRKLSVKSSIYYVYDNRYYNAFNADDINALLSRMEIGYYGVYDKKLNGSSNAKVRNISGTRREFYNFNKRELLDDFKNDYYRKLIDFDKSHNLILKLRSDIKATVDIRNYAEGSFLDYYLGQNVTIENVPKILTELQNSDKWFYSSFVNGAGQNAHRWQRKLTLPSINGNENKSFDITLEKVGGPKILKFEKNMISLPEVTDDIGKGRMRLYQDSKRDREIPLPNDAISTGSIYRLYDGDLTNSQKILFYDRWYDYYFENVLTNFGYNENQFIDWRNYSRGRYVENENHNGDFFLGHIYKDYRYKANGDKGYGLSLIDSLKDWNIKKQEIIRNGDIDHDKFKINLGDMNNNGQEVTRADLEDFLWLQGAADARVMYAATNERHLSNQDGRLLSNTPQQARELQALFEDDTLKTRYHVVDNTGSNFYSYGDKAETITRLRKSIRLNSRYVSEEELNSLEDNGYIPWNKIKEKEQHTIYSIKNPNALSKGNERIWFISKQAALTALKANLKVTNSLEELDNNLEVFNYNNGIVMMPITYKKDELEEITKKIFTYKYGEKYEEK